MIQYRTLERPGSVYLGDECFTSGATPQAAVSRIGIMPVMRTALNRWSEIETSPGVYDWSKSHLDQVTSAHQCASQAVVPVAVAGAIPSFYAASLTNSTTHAAALAFMTAFVNTGYARAGAFVIAVDPRVQESVFTARGFSPTDWASLFVDLAGVVHSVSGMMILPDIVGDNHTSYLPGPWLTAVAWPADGIGIEETSPLVSTALSDVDWFYGRASGKKVWILGTSFSTWTGIDTRAHGTEAQQADYFWTLLTSLASNYGNEVQACIQMSSADAGTASTWSDHLGVSTSGMAADKPAMFSLHTYDTNFTPYHTIIEHDRTVEVETGVPFDLGVYSPTDFDYLEWTGVTDLSQVTAVHLVFDFDTGDTYPGYLLNIAGAWRQIPTGTVDLKPWVANGKTSFKVFVPGSYLTGTVQVRDLRLVLDTNPALPDVYPPLVSGITIIKWLNVQFTDDLDPVSAASLSNYTVIDAAGRQLPISAAVLKGTRNVYLSVHNQKAVTYKLIVSGVRDDSGNAMTADTLSFKGVPAAGPEPISLRPYDLSLGIGPDGIHLHLDTADGVSGPVSVMIFDVAGRRVRTALSNGRVERSWSWLWTGDTDSGGRAAPGVYFVRVVGERGSDARHCVLR